MFEITLDFHLYYVAEIKTKEDALQDQVLIPKTNKVSVKIIIPQQDGFEVINASEIFYFKGGSVVFSNGI